MQDMRDMRDTQGTPTGQGPTPRGTGEADANGTRLAPGREGDGARDGARGDASGAGGAGGSYARHIDCSPEGQGDRAPADGHGRHR